MPSSLARRGKSAIRPQPARTGRSGRPPGLCTFSAMVVRAEVGSVIVGSSGLVRPRWRNEPARRGFAGRGPMSMRSMTEARMFASRWRPDGSAVELRCRAAGWCGRCNATSRACSDAGAATPGDRAAGRTRVGGFDVEAQTDPSTRQLVRAAAVGQGAAPAVERPLSGNTFQPGRDHPAARVLHPRHPAQVATRGVTDRHLPDEAVREGLQHLVPRLQRRRGGRRSRRRGGEPAGWCAAAASRPAAPACGTRNSTGSADRCSAGDSPGMAGGRGSVPALPRRRCPLRRYWYRPPPAAPAAPGRTPDREPGTRRPRSRAAPSSRRPR